jgi:hypothetical protein
MRRMGMVLGLAFVLGVVAPVGASATPKLYLHKEKEASSLTVGAPITLLMAISAVNPTEGVCERLAQEGTLTRTQSPTNVFTLTGGFSLISCEAGVTGKLSRVTLDWQGTLRFYSAKNEPLRFTLPGPCTYQLGSWIAHIELPGQTSTENYKLKGWLVRNLSNAECPGIRTFETAAAIFAPIGKPGELAAIEGELRG